MERIADEAGVAVQTLYYTFRTKGQLLREVIEVTAAGEEDAAPVAQRAWMQEMLTATSGQRVLALGVEHGTDIFERAAPLWPAVAAAAAADADVERYWRGVAANRRAGQSRMVARLTELGALRRGTRSRPCHRPHRRTVRPRRVPQPGQRGRLGRRRLQGVALHHPRPTASAATETHSQGLLGPLLRQPLDVAVGPRGQSAPIWSRIVLRTQRVYWSSDQPRSMTRFL